MILTGAVGDNLAPHGERTKRKERAELQGVLFDARRLGSAEVVAQLLVVLPKAE